MVGKSQSAYDECEKVSKESLSILRPIMERRGWHLCPYTEKHDQLTLGDYKGTFKGGQPVNIEFKAEVEDKYGNLFIENWSNKTTRRKGWLYNLTGAQVLIYHFLKDHTVYVVGMEALRQFPVSNYPEKPHGKREQGNDTWGYCVPILKLKQSGVIYQTGDSRTGVFSPVL